jgi:putative tRNA adenosine deaminase-associated protein
VSHFAVALLGKAGHDSWLVEEIDLEGCRSIDDIVEALRDFDQPVRLLAVEQDDEYAVLARLDVVADTNDEPIRVFLSNGHAADGYFLAELLADGLDEIGGDSLSDDEDAPPAHDSAPFGDPDMLNDLGMKSAELVELAVQEGALPIDLIVAVCERIGCLDEFEAVRR